MTTVMFHLAFPIEDVDTAKRFYVEGLGCESGRESANSVILNLYGHQLVGHTTPEPLAPQKGIYPRHFGLVFQQEGDWEALLARAEAQGLTFYQPPRRRFAGTPLEHRTFFLADPFHNLLEFKFYCHPSAIFGQAEYGTVGDAIPQAKSANTR